MSDQSAGARSFVTTTAEPLRRQLLAPTVIAAVGVCAILVIAGIDAALRGPWLDEFWTLELSDTRNGLPAGPRGLAARCPSAVFNAWATLLASLGITSIPAGRLVSNLLAAGCPTTQVYTASGWAAGPAFETHMARREDPVFERAYRSLAAPWAIPSTSSARTAWRTRHRASARCCCGTSTHPTRRRTTGLTGLLGARLSVTRSDTGFVVRADRPEGHEVSQLP